MSIVTQVRTKTNIDIMTLCKTLAEHEGYDIAVKNTEPTAKIYIPGVSIRELQVTKEKYGYEVRVSVLACKEDFGLARDTIKHLLQLTGGKAYDEDKTPIPDVDGFFTEKYIADQMDSDWSACIAFLNQGSEIGIFCPFREFFIGKNMYAILNQCGDDKSVQLEKLHALIRASQYEKITVADSPVFEIEVDTELHAKQKTLTVYEQNKFDFITYADFFVLMNEKRDFFKINFDVLEKVKPAGWVLFDEKQYKTTNLTNEEWTAFWKRAKKFEVF